MLNINGATDDPSSGFGILYDYYGKIATNSPHDNIIKTEKTVTGDIWSPVAVTQASKLTNGDINEVFVTSQIPGNKLQNSVLRRGESKLTSKITQNGHRYTNGDSLSPADPSSGPPPSSGGVIIIKEENAHSPGGSGSPRMNGILGVSGGPGAGTPNVSVSPSDDHPYQSPQLFATLSNPSAHGASPYETYGTQPGVVVSSPSQFTTSLRTGGSITLSGAAGIYTVTSPNEPYFRDYYNDYGASGVSNNTRTLSGYDGGNNDPATFVERYNRAAVGQYKTPVTIDLPSPDSGIGAETPRDHSTIQQGFDYNDICHPGLICGDSSSGTNGRTTPSQPKSTRPWHDFGRQSEADKIQIPKLFSNYGFRYYLESPISTSQRREDDRITYINKGQFYGITLEYIPESDKHLKSQTVKTVVMLVFREEKSPEDEIKAWQFWHGRQHSVKQRILDADTKNSVGLAGSIDEVAHNAIAIYWNPLESSAKINVAVQCLSTDFSSQKGVKGLPLHLQIDTYDDPRDPNCPIFHRAYCQIKVFCDKGAERKTRDEERRAAKRKLTATGRKKLDEMYHSQCDRSEFYSMSDLGKPPVLFTPAEDLDKLTSLELGFYNTNSEGSEHSGYFPNYQ
jgi:transcription factor CP2-like protein